MTALPALVDLGPVSWPVAGLVAVGLAGIGLGVLSLQRRAYLTRLLRDPFDGAGHPAATGRSVVGVWSPVVVIAVAALAGLAVSTAPPWRGSVVVGAAAAALLLTVLIGRELITRRVLQRRSARRDGSPEPPLLTLTPAVFLGFGVIGAVLADVGVGQLFASVQVPPGLAGDPAFQRLNDVVAPPVATLALGVVAAPLLLGVLAALAQVWHRTHAWRRYLERCEAFRRAYGGRA